MLRAGFGQLWPDSRQSRGAVPPPLRSVVPVTSIEARILNSVWWLGVIAGLAGNAVTDSLPGGGAAGAAVQFRMLTTAGLGTDHRRRRPHRAGLRNWITPGHPPPLTGLDNRLLTERDTIRTVLARREMVVC